MNNESDRLREALTWAVGFIRCNYPLAYEQYPDMRNCVSLIADRELFSGEFHRTHIRAELAEEKLEKIRKLICEDD